MKARKARPQIAIISAMVLLLPAQAVAQQCDAHFSFEGNLTDSSANGADGRMIGPAGAVATPQFVAGAGWVSREHAKHRRVASCPHRHDP